MFLTLYYIKGFYDPNYLYRLIFCNLECSYPTMTGITLPQNDACSPLHFIQNLNVCYSWHNFIPISIKWCLKLFLVLIPISMFLKFNFRLYFKKVITKKKKGKAKPIPNFKLNTMKQLILISSCKIVLACIIYLALTKDKAKLNILRPEEKRLNHKVYFLSVEYYRDIYQINENFTKHLQKWHCLSKIKLTSFEKCYQTLILLSGDIALNPGPISYPCSKCSKGVRVGVLCTHCDMWIHKKCEGLNASQMSQLSKNPTEMSKYICIICKGKLQNLTEIELGTPGIDVSDQFQEEIANPTPALESSFEFQEENLQNISLDDPTKTFKQKGLHFLHLNCNSLPNKIEELRQFILSTQPHVICFSETKLDKSVTDCEIKIENYTCVRKDRNRNGGGVACFIQ